MASRISGDPQAEAEGDAISRQALAIHGSPGRAERTHRRAALVTRAGRAWQGRESSAPAKATVLVVPPRY